MAMKWLIGFVVIFVIFTAIGQVSEGSFGGSNIITFQVAIERISMISTTDWIGSISNIISGLGQLVLAFFNMVLLNYTYLNQGPMQIVGWIIRGIGVIVLTYFVLDVKGTI